jgi:hypothetical protein
VAAGGWCSSFHAGGARLVRTRRVCAQRRLVRTRSRRHGTSGFGRRRVRPGRRIVRTRRRRHGTSGLGRRCLVRPGRRLVRTRRRYTCPPRWSSLLAYGNELGFRARTRRVCVVCAHAHWRVWQECRWVPWARGLSGRAPPASPTWPLTRPTAAPSHTRVLPAPTAVRTPRTTAPQRPPPKPN